MARASAKSSEPMRYANKARREGTCAPACNKASRLPKSWASSDALANIMRSGPEYG